MVLTLDGPNIRDIAHVLETDLDVTCLGGKVVIVRQNASPDLVATATLEIRLGKWKLQDFIKNFFRRLKLND